MRLTQLTTIRMSKNTNELEWCYNILSEVSRTFEIPINCMVSPQGDYTCVGYLLCRIPDTIEDTPHLSGQVKSDLLGVYRDVIESESISVAVEFENRISEIRPESPLNKKHWDLVENTSRVLQAFYKFPSHIQDVISKYVDELAYGMEMFMSRHNGSVRIEDEKELEEYCYYVAGTVGHMLVEIDLNNPDEEFHQMAEQYGLLLQTVNVSKDVYGDYYEENNVYVPATLLDKRGVNQDNLLEEDNIDNTIEAVDRVREISKSKVSSARKYLIKIADKRGSEHMRPWTIPYLLALATLRKLENNAKQSLTEGGVKISRREVNNIIKHSKQLKPYDIEELEAKISNGKLLDS